MNVAIEELGACQKKLTIQIAQEDVKKEFETVIRDIRKNVVLPGFRKGKASISTIKRKFRKDIATQVKETLIETSLKDALTDNDISPVGTPKIDYKSIAVVENQPVEYVVEIEAFPAIELQEYKGVDITKKRATEATEDQIQERLTALQRNNAVNEPVEDEHVIVDNDSVALTFQRTVDGELIDEEKQTATVWLGVDSIFPEFRENLPGKKKGDTLEFPITYPEDFQDKKFAGKVAQFAVEITNIENVILPELDDEFAKDLEEESLDALKAKIAEEIKAQQERFFLTEAKNNVIRKIAEAYDFEVPPSLLENQKKNNPNQDEAELIHQLRAGILLGRIQEKEDIQISDEDLDAAIANMAAQHQVPLAMMKSYMESQNGLDQLRRELRETKTLDFLYEHASVAEED